MELFNRYFWPFLGFFLLFFICTYFSFGYPPLILLFLPLFLATLASHLFVKNRKQDEQMKELQKKLDQLLEQTKP